LITVTFTSDSPPSFQIPHVGDDSLANKRGNSFVLQNLRHMATHFIERHIVYEKPTLITRFAIQF